MIKCLFISCSTWMQHANWCSKLMYIFKDVWWNKSHKPTRYVSWLTKGRWIKINTTMMLGYAVQTFIIFWWGILVIKNWSSAEQHLAYYFWINMIPSVRLWFYVKCHQNACLTTHYLEPCLGWVWYIRE